MSTSKKTEIPLYMQIKNSIIDQIEKGELQPGDMLLPELELCKVYDASRFPVRQAMMELVKEGYLQRTRGRGTFVSKELSQVNSGSENINSQKTNAQNTSPENINSKNINSKNMNSDYRNPEYGNNRINNAEHKNLGCNCFKNKNPILGLVLGNYTSGFTSSIFSGFQKQAWKRGYFTIACYSENSSDEESLCIDRLIENQVDGIVLFPCDKTLIGSKLGKLKENNTYLGLIDRNPGLADVDYTGSDNRGGAYSAVRHIAMQGFRNVAFVSDMSNVSSINERLEGYLKAVEDFGMNAVTRIDIQEDLSKYPYYMHRFFIEKLKDELMDLQKYLPLGIFAINDGIAVQCVNILDERGLAIGKDVGIVGFDNNPETQYMNKPLTTVAQNGLLIGSNAADIAADKIEGKANLVYRSIVPTQLIIRNSCGERQI
ncbi:MAG TPA: GntR family transcriptional regulator [Clostridiales bacterium]|nr:GntR family transcriptional regulator [Clostridiales bacterium]